MRENLKAVLKEARSAGLLPIVGATHLALARCDLEMGRPNEAVRQASLAAEAANSLQQRDLLFQAHHAAGSSMRNLGEMSSALRHFGAALEALAEMRSGLEDRARRHFLRRPETTTFAEDAEEAFRDLNRDDEGGRLRGLVRP